MTGKDLKTSEIMLDIASHYLMNGCDRCDFLCVSKTCDSIPIHCNWMRLYYHFKRIEEKDGEQNDKR